MSKLDKQNQREIDSKGDGTNSVSDEFLEEGLQKNDMVDLQATRRRSLSVCGKRICCFHGSSISDERKDNDSGTMRRKRLFRLALTAHILFLIGAALQVYGSHLDLHWIKSIQHLPRAVLRARDDATWIAYQRREHYQKNSRRSLEISTIQTENTNVTWQHLSDDYKSALLVLGHNKTTWDGRVYSQVLSYSWSELTKEQKAAAEVFGYDEDHWDFNESQEDVLEVFQELFRVTTV